MVFSHAQSGIVLGVGNRELCSSISFSSFLFVCLFVCLFVVVAVVVVISVHLICADLRVRCTASVPLFPASLSQGSFRTAPCRHGSTGGDDVLQSDRWWLTLVRSLVGCLPKEMMYVGHIVGGLPSEGDDLRQSDRWWATLVRLLVGYLSQIAGGLPSSDRWRATFVRSLVGYLPKEMIYISQIGDGLPSKGDDLHRSDRWWDTFRRR